MSLASRASSPYRGAGVRHVKVHWDQELGSGCYGKVYAGTLTGPKWKDVPVAVKIVDVQHSDSKKVLALRKMCLRESTAMLSVYHPALTNCVATTQQMEIPDSDLYYVGIVSERARTELAQLLEEEQKGVPMSWTNSAGEDVVWDDTKRVICVIGIAAGLAAIHSRNLMHRDIKPANIMVDENMFPKICDFGFARTVYEDTLGIQKRADMTQAIGTPCYMAPEIIAGEGRYDSKVDVFSFSLIMFEMLTLAPPFKHKAQQTKFAVWNYIKSGQRPDFPVGVNELWKEIIEHCWDPLPEERWSMEDVLKEIDSRLEEFLLPETDINSVEDYIAQIKDYHPNVWN